MKSVQSMLDRFHAGLYHTLENNTRCTGRKQMVTLKDIANECGVSAATVSRALNGQDAISRETVDKIRETAARMGYFPNAAARMLKTNRSYNIGIVYEDKMHHEYFSVLIDSMRSAADKKGYDLTFLSPDFGGSFRTYLEHARYRGVDGVVLVQTDFESENVRELVRGSIPCVSIDYRYDCCDAVLADNVNSMVSLVDYAVSKGRKRIAMICGEDCYVTRQRVLGYRKGLEKQGIGFDPVFLRAGRFRNPEETGCLVRALLSLPERPDCILCPDDYSCLGALSEIGKHDLKIPEDISITGFDGILLAGMLRLTTYSQNAVRMGECAVEQLIRAIGRPHASEYITVTGHLQPGDTL